MAGPADYTSPGLDRLHGFSILTKALHGRPAACDTFGGGARLYGALTRFLVERGEVDRATAYFSRRPASWRVHAAEVFEARCELVAAAGAWGELPDAAGGNGSRNDESCRSAEGACLEYLDYVDVKILFENRDSHSGSSAQEVVIAPAKALCLRENRNRGRAPCFVGEDLALEIERRIYRPPGR